jgi:hypothetical protein
MSSPEGSLPVPVGDDLGDRCDVLDTADRTDLQGVHGDVLEEAARLVGDPIGVDRQDALDPGRVLDGDGGDDRQRVAAHARERQQISLQAATSGGVGTGERQHDRRRGAARRKGHLGHARTAPGARARDFRLASERLGRIR